MGLGDLKDSIIRKLALRWLRGRVEDTRSSKEETGMKKTLKFLDGWKLVIGVLITVIVGVYDHATGNKTSDLVGTVLSVLGYGPDQNGVSGSQIGSVLGAVMIIVGFVGKIWKAQQQLRAGTPLSGTLSTEGYVIKQEADLEEHKPEAIIVERAINEAIAAKKD